MTTPLQDPRSYKRRRVPSGGAVQPGSQGFKSDMDILQESMMACLTWLRHRLYLIKITLSEITPPEETKAIKPWSDLPLEMLEHILTYLGLIDLLSFRGTCKDWRAASSATRAQDESYSKDTPWLLLYEKYNIDGKATLLNTIDLKRYCIDLPELRGAHCLASLQGWLLLHYENRWLIFFSPFSRAIIKLPDFPILEINDHVAALSAPPTSENCVICVINRKNEIAMDLHVLHRGDEKWKYVEYVNAYPRLDTVTGAIYAKGKFYFLDNKSKLVTYTEREEEWRAYNIVESSRSEDIERLPFNIKINHFHAGGTGKLAELEDDVSVSTCGTVIFKHGMETVIHNEIVNPSGESENIRHHNGIWIQPLFWQIGPDQSWAL